jgi:hypothetical protein
VVFAFFAPSRPAITTEAPACARPRARPSYPAIVAGDDGGSGLQIEQLGVFPRKIDVLTYGGRLLGMVIMLASSVMKLNAAKSWWTPVGLTKSLLADLLQRIYSGWDCETMRSLLNGLLRTLKHFALIV